MTVRQFYWQCEFCGHVVTAWAKEGSVFTFPENCAGCHALALWYEQKQRRDKEVVK